MRWRPTFKKLLRALPLYTKHEVARMATLLGGGILFINIALALTGNIQLPEALRLELNFQITEQQQVAAVTTTYTTPGTYTFIVPSYVNLTVEAWGAGAGGAYSAVGGGTVQGTAGGNTTFASITAGRGSWGTAGGGVASGGNVNTNGGGGLGVIVDCATSRGGGNSPNGGTGGLSGENGCVTPAQLTPSAPGAGGGSFGCSSVAFPGGVRRCNIPAGGGAGGYVSKTYAVGALTPGESITVVVGAGGAGASGAQGKAGTGAVGKVTITWSGGNTAPVAPTVDGPTSGQPSISYTHTFIGTDPNTDPVHYGIDWDNNSIVDEWLPAIQTQYVTSGTQQSSSHSWSSAGVYTFKALTQDSNGANSGWTSYTITIANSPNAPSASGISLGPNSYTYTLTATDPGANTVRYGLDWNSDGTVDEWTPSSGYVASGVGSVASHTWSGSKPATYKALAQNSFGFNSSWATLPVDTAPTCTLSAVSPINVGQPTTLTASFSGGLLSSASISQGVGTLSQTKIFKTSGTTWTVPTDWNSNNNTIEVIGGGGSGRAGLATYAGSAGGGGAYSKIINTALTIGASIVYRVGTGGAGVSGRGVDGNTGGDTFFNRTAGSGNTCADAVSVCAKGGAGGVIGGALGGAAASGVGTVKFSGGIGGSYSDTPNFSGGAGGAGGSTGDGVDGSTSSPGNAGAGDSSIGGNGGNGSTSGAGAAGSIGTEWNATHGSGGGSGGSYGTSVVGNTGGLYGGGGGGAGNSGSGSVTSGAGAAGLIAISYYPTINDSPTSNTSYLLTVSGTGGTNTCSAAVVVNTTPPSVSSFSTSRVQRGAVPTLSWNITGMTSGSTCTITPVPPSGQIAWNNQSSWSGSVTAAPVNGAVTYTLSCGNGVATTSRSTSAAVVPTFQEI